MPSTAPSCHSTELCDEWADGGSSVLPYKSAECQVFPGVQQTNRFVSLRSRSTQDRMLNSAQPRIPIFGEYKVAEIFICKKDNYLHKVYDLGTMLGTIGAWH